MGTTKSFDSLTVRYVGKSKDGHEIVEIQNGAKSQLFEALLPGEWGCRILGPYKISDIKNYAPGFLLCKSHSYFLRKEANGTCMEKLSLEDYLKEIGFLPL